MKTSDLTGALLDYWVARAIDSGRAHYFEDEGEWYATLGGRPVYYSRSWSEGGPIIERERIETAVTYVNEVMDGWAGMAFEKDDPSPHAMISEHGPTLLIAAMRAFVACKFGDEVPDDMGGV